MVFPLMTVLDGTAAAGGAITGGEAEGTTKGVTPVPGPVFCVGRRRVTPPVSAANRLDADSPEDEEDGELSCTARDPPPLGFTLL